MPLNVSYLFLWVWCVVLFVSDPCPAGQAEIVQTWSWSHSGVCGLAKPLWSTDRALQTSLHCILTSQSSWARPSSLVPVWAPLQQVTSSDGL